MQSDMNPNSKTRAPSKSPTPKHVGLGEDLRSLSVELSRTAHSVRMKAKGASTELKDVLDMLDREVTRFSARVVYATDDTREVLEQLGRDLRRRFEELARRIAMPSS